MIGCHSKVSCTSLDHGQNGGHDTSYRADLLPVRICCGGHCEKMAEQFVGSVDQVHIHMVSDQLPWRATLQDRAKNLEIVPMLPAIRIHIPAWVVYEA